MSDFSSVLAEIGPVASRERLLAVAPRLDAARARTTAIAGRIDAERLEDRRLESQRARAATALDGVVAAMSLVSDAATAGEPGKLAEFTIQYADSVGDLRRISARS